MVELDWLILPIVQGNPRETWLILSEDDADPGIK